MVASLVNMIELIGLTLTPLSLKMRKFTKCFPVQGGRGVIHVCTLELDLW